MLALERRTGDMGPAGDVRHYAPVGPAEPHRARTGPFDAVAALVHEAMMIRAQVGSTIRTTEASQPRRRTVSGVSAGTPRTSFSIWAPVACRPISTRLASISGVATRVIARTLQ